MKSLTLISAAIFQNLQALTTWQMQSWRLDILRIWNLLVQPSKRSTVQSRNERNWITRTEESLSQLLLYPLCGQYYGSQFSQ